MKYGRIRLFPSILMASCVGIRNTCRTRLSSIGINSRRSRKPAPSDWLIQAPYSSSTLTAQTARCTQTALHPDVGSCLQRVDDVGDQPEIVLDQFIARVLIPFGHQSEVQRFFLFAQRLGKGVVFHIGDQEGQLLDE